MDKDSNPFLLSQILLGVDYSNILAIAKSKGIDTNIVSKALREASDECERHIKGDPKFSYTKNITYLKLHTIGFSTTELGKIMGVTKQSISSRIKTISNKSLRRVENNYHDLPTISEIKLKLWKDVIKNPDMWYNESGRLNKRKVQKFIVTFGYKWRHAEKLRSKLTGSKPEIILTVIYDLSTKDDKINYLRERLKNYTVLELYQEVMNRSKLKCHYMTFYRYIISLGLTLKVHPKRGLK